MRRRRRSRLDWRGILALAHRGVTHVRGKDCVHPDIDQLRRQARELLEVYRAQSPDAIIEVAAHHRTATPDTFALHDAQFVLARSYGFESWPKLKAAVEGVTTKRLHEAVQKGDLGAVRALLARRPAIVDLLREGPSGF